MKTFYTRLIIIIFSIYYTNIYSQQIVYITDYGYVPNSTNNVIPVLNKAIEEASLHDSATIIFPKGRYDFWPTLTDSREYTIGMNFINLNNITIEGNGSEFIFHGRMQIANLDSCINVSLQNFSVDWDRPYISQAKIEEISDSYLDVSINRKEYPFIIERDTIFFIGENWKKPVIEMYNNLYDKDTKEIIYNTWDSPLGDIFTKKAEELPNGNVRFNGKTKYKPEKGSFVTLYHERYAVTGIAIQNSKDIVLKNLTIFHALSNGVHGFRTENITMDNTSMTVNDYKGRVFSTIADASHFTNCKGLIKVINCAHTGQGDDFINIRGTNAQIKKIINNKSIEVSQRGNTTLPGDEVWFINKDNSQRGETSLIEFREPIYENKRLIGYRFTFTEPISDKIKVDDFIENKTWNPSVEIRNNRILKRNRARGILVTTPMEVNISDNYFRSAGTAILIEGDLDYWFESGAHNNLNIYNNIFEDCLSSGNRDEARGQWGDAVITITPSHKPKSDKDEPYHKNIRIYNNTFKVFDAPIVRARSVRNLDFIENKIEKTYTYLPYTWQKTAFMLDGCRNVVIKNNNIDENYKTTNIAIEHMKKSDINTDIFKIEDLDINMFNTHLEW